MRRATCLSRTFDRRWPQEHAKRAQSPHKHARIPTATKTLRIAKEHMPFSRWGARKTTTEEKQQNNEKNAAAESESPSEHPTRTLDPKRIRMNRNPSF